MAELAVVSARRPRLQAMARRRGRSVQARGAQIALQLGENPGRFLSSVQTGITLIGILAGAYSGATLADPLAGWLVARFPLLDGIAGNLAFGQIGRASCRERVCQYV